MMTAACVIGLHGFCKEDHTGCACPVCHLGPCTRCGGDNFQRLFDGLCASCERTRARNIKHITHCDACGSPNAYRNPGHRKNVYLCNTCHRKNGDPIALPNSMAGLIAFCHGRDQSDPSHTWQHIRGTRYICEACHVSKFDPKQRAAEQRARLNIRS